MEQLVLYNYFRSSSSYRVRLALHFKELSFEYKPINLLTQENRQPEFLAIHPAGQVPVLVHGHLKLGQSLVILQYLEEVFPQKPLIPQDQNYRLAVWEMAQVINSTQPLHNFPVLRRLELYGLSSQHQQEWIHWVLDNSFSSLHGLRQRFSSHNTWALGNQITLADCVLIPQLYVAVRFQYPLKERFPEFESLRQKYLGLPWVQKAHPHQQIDCPENLRNELW